MIKDYKRYRNFMIVFEDDRYYVCKASTFSKDGNNRYSFGEFETIDDAKKRIDKYYSERDKEEESMRKYESVGNPADDEELEILNEIEDDDEELVACEDTDSLEVEATNPSNIGSFKRSSILTKNRARKHKKNIDESFVHIQNEDQLKSTISQIKSSPVGTVVTINGGTGEWNSDGSKSEVTYKKEEDELWHFVKSSGSGLKGSFPGSADPEFGISYRHLPICGGNKVKITEDRIITKDDELNKPTNVKDDEINDTIDINVSTNNAPASNDTNSSDTSEQQKDEVILTEVSDFDKSKITIEQGAVINTRYGDITVNRIYAHWNPFENKVETKADIELDKNGKKAGYDTISVEKIFSYID